jgi:DNA-binding CsgD family transcriptional regulator
MQTPAGRALDTLTEREKATLRLIVRGHDAKSAARTLDLSVHTINERLREARRKLAVPSSREAARLLFEAEGGTPEIVGDSEIGEAAELPSTEEGIAPDGGAPRAGRPRLFIGVIVMTLTLGLIALIGFTQSATPPLAPTQQATANAEVVEAAQRFFALIDANDWRGSYQRFGAGFRKTNSEQAWTAACEKMRERFGAMESRRFESWEEVPAPPEGYELVRFRTSFANKADAIERVAFAREGNEWKVVGVTVE